MHTLLSIQQVLICVAASSIGLGCAASAQRKPPEQPQFIRASPIVERPSHAAEDAVFGTQGVYTYDPDGYYEVMTAPGYITDIALEPGERLREPVAAGDTANWRFYVGTSVNGGVTQHHVYIRPATGDLRTNVVLLTDRRVYRIDLKSSAGIFLAEVRWTYPGELTPAQVGPVDESDEGSLIRREM